jgi:hypothetical protein
MHAKGLLNSQAFLLLSIPQKIILNEIFMGKTAKKTALLLE